MSERIIVPAPEPEKFDPFARTNRFGTLPGNRLGPPIPRYIEGDDAGNDEKQWKACPMFE